MKYIFAKAKVYKKFIDAIYNLEKKIASKKTTYKDKS